MKYIFLLAVLPAAVFFSKPDSGKNSFEVYQNSIPIDEVQVIDKFQEVSRIFEAFTGKNQKTVKMKMGEDAHITHIFYKEFRKNNTEVKYDLKISFTEDGFKITAHAYEYLLFNKKRTKFRLIEPIQLATIAGDERIIACNQFISNEADRLFETLKMEYQSLD